VAALSPLSFRAGTYSGVFTLLRLLTGEGRAHHGDILREATRLAEAGKLRPRIDPRRFTFDTICHAYQAIRSGTAAGKIIVDTESVTSPK
jgi:NADPH2:quinone reductase